MKRAFNLLSAAVVALIFIVACQKEAGMPHTPGEKPVESKLVNTSFQGRVVNESGIPIAGVNVSAGTKTATTDNDGIFRITDVSVPDLFGNVKAVKSGYFPGSRTVLTNVDGYNFVEIQLIKRSLAGTVESSSPTTISITTNVSVTFSGNSFVTENGNAYSGKVNVFGAYLDPESAEFSRIMPGDLRGINANNNLTALVSYGMMAIELEGIGGETLQLAQGNKVTISAEIPSSMLGNAPSTIPLWFFDESKGVWVEEGSAAKSGNRYTGEVSHFTYWNYDVPSDFIYASLKLVNQQNDPLPYSFVKIYDTRNMSYGTGYTDSTGFIKMWVPKNAPLQINVINACNEIIHVENAGPFSEDTDLEEIAVNVPEAGNVEITGTAVNCDNLPVTNGYVNIRSKGLNYRSTVTDGQFSAIIERCSVEPVTAEIVLVDMGTLKQSAPAQLAITSGAVSAGQLRACDIEVNEYFDISIGDKRYEWRVPGDTLIYNRTGKITEISIFHMNDGQGIGFKLNDTIPHEGYTYASIYAGAVHYAGSSVYYNLTAYGRKNEYIELQLSGFVTSDSAQSGAIKAISGNVRVRRRF